MIIKLTHPFLWRCKGREALLDTNKFNTFCRNLNKQAKELFPKDPDKENKYKGDGFELFVEAMIKLFPCDKRLALIEGYTVNTNTDVGVDGYGICGANGKPITVQCKYRQHDYVLTANQDHLTNFTSASMLHFNVSRTPDKNGKCNMVIISSADSLNFFTDNEMFGNMVHSFCRDSIRKLVDNNDTFWKYFLQLWNEALEELLKEE